MADANGNQKPTPKKPEPELRLELKTPSPKRPQKRLEARRQLAATPSQGCQTSLSLLGPIPKEVLDILQQYTSPDEGYASDVGKDGGDGGGDRGV